MAIAITRQEESATELRRLARASRDVAQARRLLAIALVMQGRSRTDAATAAGMDRQSLRDWVHRLNADGPAGLLDKPRSGRPPRLSEGQLRAFDAIVESGPDLRPTVSCGGYLPTGSSDATGSEHGRPRCNDGLRGVVKADSLAVRALLISND